MSAGGLRMAVVLERNRHVHLHVIRRYATARLVAGVRFQDPDYPGHYSVPGPERRVSTEALDALAQLLCKAG